VDAEAEGFAQFVEARQRALQRRRGCWRGTGRWPRTWCRRRWCGRGRGGSGSGGAMTRRFMSAARWSIAGRAGGAVDGGRAALRGRAWRTGRRGSGDRGGGARHSAWCAPIA